MVVTNFGLLRSCQEFTEVNKGQYSGCTPPTFVKLVSVKQHFILGLGRVPCFPHTGRSLLEAQVLANHHYLLSEALGKFHGCLMTPSGAGYLKRAGEKATGHGKCVGSDIRSARCTGLHALVVSLLPASAQAWGFCGLLGLVLLHTHPRPGTAAQVTAFGTEEELACELREAVARLAGAAALGRWCICRVSAPPLWQRHRRPKGGSVEENENSHRQGK